MKKILAILALAVSGTAFAVDFVSVDVENVSGRKSNGNDSTVQYLRAGKEIGGTQFGIQGRTARLKDESGMLSSVEVTLQVLHHSLVLVMTTVSTVLSLTTMV